MKVFSERNVRYAVVVLLSVVIGWLIAKSGAKLSLVFPMIPFVLLFLIISFRKPEYLMHVVLFIAFTNSLFSRYIPGAPFGLAVDGLLILIAIVLVFDKHQKFNKDFLFNGLTLAVFGWLIFSFIEILNPLAKSKAAWFYANRGFSFYPFLMVILSMYVYDQKKHLKAFLLIWVGLSAFGTLWGMKQLFLGVSAVEQAWLNAGAASTHILFGKLRVFSYYTDAAQFGASQAHTAVVFGIIALYTGKMKYRIPILIFALLSFYGMLISGTRGALAIIAIGGLTYFIMTKNFRVVILGLMVGVGAFVFLKYTTIMQSNYQVNRLRSALDSDDPSLKVRIERQNVLKGYLSDKPLGGGIGSAGYWGKRFTPGTFLAEIGTDGHYTRVWMETGIIGLYLYLLMLIVILFYLGRLLWTMPTSLHRQILIGFYSGYVGVCVASYSNGLLTQLPTGALIFVGLALIFVGARKEKAPVEQHTPAGATNHHPL